MRKALILIVLLISSAGAHELSAQSLFRRYINLVLNDTTAADRSQFMVYPTVAFAPETSWEFGFSSLLVYYAQGDTANRLSEVSAFTFLTLESQWGLWFDHALYSHEDKWFFLGRLRFQNFPLRYYGIGSDTPPRHQAVVDARQVLIKERVLRKLYKDVFFGLEFDFQRMSRVDFQPGPASDILELPRGADGSTNLGIGLGLLFDSRHNVLNVRDGFFSELAYLHYLPGLSTFGFSSVISDTRIFKPVAKNLILAGQVLGHFNFGDVPFNQLALMGGESMMRGYYLGRFRDRHQVAAQAEMRFLPLPLGFTERWGAAAFAGMATVFNDFGRATSRDLVWSAGAGIRFLLFPNKDIYTRFDVAFTAEGTGYYIFIGEAF